jgi:hypothetical protein
MFIIGFMLTWIHWGFKAICNNMRYSLVTDSLGFSLRNNNDFRNPTVFGGILGEITRTKTTRSVIKFQAG